MIEESNVTSDPFRARDFIETAEGLAFALVLDGQHAERLIGTLRYRRVDSKWVKLPTQEAQQFLVSSRPDLLQHDPRFDCQVTGIPRDQIVNHHRPEVALRERVEGGAKQTTTMAVERVLVRTVDWLIKQGVSVESLGVTGSLLIGAHSNTSDVDLLIRNEVDFQKARTALALAFEQGELQEPNEAMWRDAWNKRASSLPFDAYLWHQRRKRVNAWSEGIKVDLSLGTPTEIPEPGIKETRTTIKARIVDDSRGFGLPSLWRCEHESIDTILTYSATYSGQVQEGEWVEACGMIETTASGRRRIVIGSDRESQGDWLRVVDATTQHQQDLPR